MKQPEKQNKKGSSYEKFFLVLLSVFLLTACAKQTQDQSDNAYTAAPGETTQTPETNIYNEIRPIKVHLVRLTMV